MYSFKSRVRYSEVDKDGYLSLEAIMNYFQDCSSFHSEDLGVGLGFLQERKLGWMIIAWHVRILKRARMGEEITIGTWPYSFKHIKGGRNYVLKNADGEIFVDRTGKAAGRGAYVCDGEECLKKLADKKLLHKAFSTNVDGGVYQNIGESGFGNNGK